MDKPFKLVFDEHDGKVSDTWSLYVDEWERVFSPYRDQPAQILEIGVQNGGSLEIWGKTYLKAKKIVGCDIDEKCAQLRFDDPRIKIIIGDANTDDCEGRILQAAPSFDVIIDDGSHKSSEIVRSFARYFPHLNDDGIYIIEDLHASYWKDFEGGLNNPLSAMAFFRRLTDIINYEHWRNNSPRGKVLQKFAEEFGVKFDDIILARIHSIEFLNSLCIIKKLSPNKNVLGKRVVVGQEDLVANEWEKYNGTAIQDIPAEISDDTNLDVNELIAQTASLGKAILDREREISDLTGQLSEKEQQTKEVQEQLAALEQQRTDLQVQLAEKEHTLTAKIAQLEKLNLKYKEDLSQRSQVIQTLFSRLSKKESELVSTEKEREAAFSQLEASTIEANTFSSQLWEIKHSHAWSVVQLIWKLRLRFLPSGSIQSRMLRSIFGKFRVLRNEGISSFLKNIKPASSGSRIQRTRSRTDVAAMSQKPEVPVTFVHPDPVYTSTLLDGTTQDVVVTATSSEHLDDPVGLLERALSNMKYEKFLVSISHDDYLTVNFGVQMFISDEQKNYNEKQISYLHLYPIDGPDYLMQDSPLSLGLNIDSAHMGQYSVNDIVDLLGKLLANDHSCVSVNLHQFKGWTRDALFSVISAVQPSHHFFYVHDYYAVCPQYTLLRNQREFCNAPPVNSHSCTICMFEKKRAMHLPMVEQLFTHFPFLIITPSENTKHLWERAFPNLNNEVRVEPHLTLKETTIPLPSKNYETIRIAYAGQGVPQKGWDTWRKLVDQLAPYPDYELFHLGSWAGKNPEYFESVRVTPENRTAMIDALKRNQIDVLFHWSILPETFSFVLYEAIGAGCFVITVNQSGNVADYVNENKNGLVFDTYSDLLNYLSTPDHLRKDLTEFRKNHPKLYTLEHNTAVIDLINLPHPSGGIQ